MAESSLRGRWIPADLLIHYMNQKFNIGSDMLLTTRTLMTYMNKCYPSMSYDPNRITIPSGTVVDFYRANCQVKSVRYNLFFFSDHGSPAPLFPKNSNVASFLNNSVTKRLLGGSRQIRTAEVMDNLEVGSLNKRAKLMNSNEADTPSIEALNQHQSSSTISDNIEQEQARLSIDYWKSGEARTLFAPKAKYGDEANVKGVVISRIELFESINRHPNHWKLLVEGGDADKHCSEFEIFMLRQRSLYLACALRQFVQKEIGEPRWTWQQCLQYSIVVMNDLGLEAYSNVRTLGRWHRQLAYNLQDAFCKSSIKKDKIPPFLQSNPDAMNAFKKFGIANLNDLSVEKMYEYVHEHLVPTLVASLGVDVPDDCDVYEDLPARPGVVEDSELNNSREQFLLTYGLTKISICTIARWMHAVGFKYETRRKHYFVDGHEKADTLAYRRIFIAEYFKKEVNAPRWVHFTAEKSKLLESQGLVVKNTGFHYSDHDGTSMVEYHADNFDTSPDLPMGGNCSVRKKNDEQTVMIFGQEEAIFKQFLLNIKMWTGPNGERPLLPKDEGSGVMISSFITREHGLIREIDDYILTTVNANRLGASYADEEAAIDVHGTKKKKPLTKNNSPFLVYFDYGENRDGYWNYNHMVCQFEDTIDVLKVMHPHYKFVYLFDHSSGHSKHRPDGLSSIRMKKTFGGKGLPMRPTIIEQEAGFLGPFQRKLQPGQTQHLTFQPDDVGPCWLTPAEQEASRHDTIIGVPKEIQRSRAQLIFDLAAKGANTKGKNKSDLVFLCPQYQVPTSTQISRVKEGWEGKSKGLVQVLWERGLIDVTKLNSYTLTGRKDSFGLIECNTSLRHLMSLCSDFLNEQGMMQYIGTKLGVEVMLSPKCHAEIAGEGVEYMWACAKGTYRNLALKEKKGKSNFMASVRTCLSAEVITGARIRKFSRRARQYMLAYHALDSGLFEPELQQQRSKHGPVEIDNLIKKMKTHRCALDFDYKFVMNVDE